MLGSSTVFLLEDRSHGAEELKYQASEIFN